MVKIGITKNQFALLTVAVLLSFMLEFSYADSSIFSIRGNWQSGDQYAVVASAYAISNDAYLSNDVIAAAFPRMYPPFIFYTISFVYDFIGSMYVTMFILTLLIKFVFVFSTFKLSLFILDDSRKAILASIILSFTHFMIPEELGVSQFIAKNVAFSFVPFILYIFLRYRNTRGSLFSMASLGLFSNFHLITMAPLTLPLCFSMVKEKRFKDVVSSIIAFLVFSLPVIYFGVFQRGQISIEM